MKLIWPAAEYLSGYVDALQRGWSLHEERGEVAAMEALQRISRDPIAFVKGQVDREGKGEPAILLDGTRVPRIPGYNRWLWDGEFCGNIFLRWQLGTSTLPPLHLGHIGYSVVPWKRRRGYATRALQLLLPEARAEGLEYVEIVTSLENIGSQRVIEANGGILVEKFRKTPKEFEASELLRYRIDCPGSV